MEEMHIAREMWIARDKNNSLYLHIGSKPVKFISSWVNTELYCVSIRLDEKEHPEVQWSDEEPTKVKLVIDI